MVKSSLVVEISNKSSRFADPKARWNREARRCAHCTLHEATLIWNGDRTRIVSSYHHCLGCWMAESYAYAPEYEKTIQLGINCHE